ncbi:NAD(P)-dependent dehydrogenase, short-chain alcohol dehydrogenase family [Nocardioides scoriae]|uniref:NAD(P)-dependent dehydrogenase, short-chain alcohol dehydrogenase family n=1 Tax=Nocardioides scoriae TaxID=642780 RepID=A0A1H1PEI0_9ACTN|nr:SDR family NAD(P)-dependent oxidoreductase [Nocardioides scoriae]SDS09500.1 NAD(P)-dependent dehydrogenase, short-chain alcohol dehydrogenase family [Nocardioides scoriae]
MSRPRYDLTGKVVLVTGGNGGIGAATGREVLGRGGRLVVADLDPETPRRAAALGDAALGCVADVRDRSSLDEVVARAVERFGRLDVVVANAGLLARAATLRNTPVADVEATLSVNVTGVVNTIGAGMEELVRHRGQVVLISSVFAYLNGMGTIPYAMSKAAVEQLGRGLRVELADHGVSVLTAYFSLVDTDMIRRGVDADDVVLELLSTLPAVMLERVTAASAAAAVADGLERRAVRVVHPRRWQPVSALRGLLGPVLDDRFATDRRILDVLARLDARPTTTDRTGHPSNADEMS